MNTYNRFAVAFDHGKGALLYDQKGNEYLDALSGIAVTGLGHAHPKISACIEQQAKKLIHTSNLYHIPNQTQLADELTKLTGLRNAFFTNSGAEANETAIKLARLFGRKKGIENPQIIVMEHAFHGRTLATLTASGNRKIQAGFEPLVSGFIRAPFNDINALKAIAESQSGSVCAVFFEPIQGEGGIRIPDQDYLNQVRTLCDEQGWLMALDEVQTGNGRTGSYFAYQPHGIKPDILTTAKGLGNGFPIGVCLAGEQVAQTFGPGNHGSTYGGSPLACAVGHQVVETLFEEQLIHNAAKMGDYMLEGFKSLLEGRDYIRDIRGKGLMLGIDLDDNCAELASLALSQKLLINVTAGNTIRLLPPLIYTQSQADQLIETLSKLIRVFKGDDRTKAR